MTFLKTLKSFFIILSWQTILTIITSIAATYACRHFNFFGDFPLTLVGIAIVFPLVFSINSAYKRRETALKHYANLKGNGRAIFFAARDWIEDAKPENIKTTKAKLESLFTAFSVYFHTDLEVDNSKEDDVLIAFRDMSLNIKGFRAQGMSSSEVSRTNQYLSKMMGDFEHLKHIHQYRTPLTLRAYSKVFITLLPVIYAPYFAEVSQNDATPTISFILAGLFSLILVSLDNIQEHLESPFDNIGEDDIKINDVKFITGLEK